MFWRSYELTRMYCIRIRIRIRVSVRAASECCAPQGVGVRRFGTGRIAAELSCELSGARYGT